MPVPLPILRLPKVILPTCTVQAPWRPQPHHLPRCLCSTHVHSLLASRPRAHLRCLVARLATVLCAHPLSSLVSADCSQSACPRVPLASPHSSPCPLLPLPPCTAAAPAALVHVVPGACFAATTNPSALAGQRIWQEQRGPGMDRLAQREKEWVDGAGWKAHDKLVNQVVVQDAWLPGP